MMVAEQHDAGPRVDRTRRARRGAVTDVAAARLVWPAFGLAALALVAALGFTLLNWSSELVDRWEWVYPVGIFSFALVGALILSRLPRHPIGWIMLGVGMAWQLLAVGDGYAHYGLVTNPGSLPRPDLALALSTWLWVPGVGVLGTFLILLFPDDHLTSPRWRAWARLSAVVLVLNSIVGVVMPGTFENEGYPGVDNPLGIEVLEPITGALQAGVVLLAICMVGCAVGVIRRFRRSSGLERLQLKWLAAGGGIVATLYMVAIVAAGMHELWGIPEVWSDVLVQAAVVSFLLVPVAAGNAILRYRLYDIDIIINRALVYGVLTSIMTGTYLIVVTSLQGLLRPVSGESQIAVAASTLVVAGLFRPVRRRVQALIDRRFYRRKYDAARTLESFSATLREELDLDALTTELLGVVNEVIQPTRVSLWLNRPPDEKPAR
jgi:hypothetical protein